MANLKINGTGLEYIEEGKGEPLVLVHGSASDYRIWKSHQKEFAKKFRTIRYSRRYHYPNMVMPEGKEYIMEEHVNDLEKLLFQLNAYPAHLVGHSYGGFIALLLATRAPELVKTLTLAEPPVITLFVSNKPKAAEILKLILTRPLTAKAIVKFGVKGAEPAKKAFIKGDNEEGLKRFGNAVFGKGGYDRLPDNIKQRVKENLVTVKGELLGPGFLELEDNQVKNIKVPVLLLTGDKSIDLFHRLTDRLEELLPNVKRVSVSGASHLLQEDNPKEFDNYVLSFLAGK